MGFITFACQQGYALAMKCAGKRTIEKGSCIRGSCELRVTWHHALCVRSFRFTKIRIHNRLWLALSSAGIHCYCRRQCGTGNCLPDKKQGDDAKCSKALRSTNW